jgi:hypothetical protein
MAAIATRPNDFGGRAREAVESVAVRTGGSGGAAIALGGAGGGGGGTAAIGGGAAGGTGARASVGASVGRRRRSFGRVRIAGPRQGRRQLAPHAAISAASAARRTGGCGAGGSFVRAARVADQRAR